MPRTLGCHGEIGREWKEWWTAMGLRAVFHGRRRPISADEPSTPEAYNRGPTKLERSDVSTAEHLVNESRLAADGSARQSDVRAREQPDRPEALISYSRVDRDFVGIVSALCWPSAGKTSGLTWKTLLQPQTGVSVCALESGRRRCCCSSSVPSRYEPRRVVTSLRPPSRCINQSCQLFAVTSTRARRRRQSSS